MRKLSIYLLIILLSSQSISAQSNWEKIKINNWGIIAIPNSMEVQSGLYKKIADKAKQEFSVNAERVVFQQKGVNKGENLNTYARVIMRTDYGTETLPNLNKEILNANDISDLNSVYKAQLNELSTNSKYPAKIIKWNSVKIITIAGQKCINYSYIRQMGNNPQTYSEFYIFWKGKNQYTINTEYWIRDSEKWKTDISKSINSFKFL